MPVAMVALLKRSDADLFRLQQGDWEEIAQRLCADHPFSVTPVLVAHYASGVDGVAWRIAERLQAYDVGKQWFECDIATAVNAFADEVIAANGVSFRNLGRAPVAPRDTAATTQISGATMSLLPVPELAREPPPLPDDCTSDDATSDDDEMWEHLEACAGRDADKACDVRCALEASLGKEAAKRVLRKTKPSTTKNQQGQKTRMLRTGKHFLKLRRGESVPIAIERPEPADLSEEVREPS